MSEPRSGAPAITAAEVAGEHGEAVQRREPARRKPHCTHLEDGDECHRHTHAYQRPAEGRDLPRGRESERERATNATSEPVVRIRRGPSVSASTPTGTCSTMYT